MTSPSASPTLILFTQISASIFSDEELQANLLSAQARSFVFLSRRMVLGLEGLMMSGAIDDGVLEFERARRAIAMDNTLAGLASIEKALSLNDNKAWYSYLGYCVAKERGQVSRGAELCTISLEFDPSDPAHYLNLGKIQLLSGNKAEALSVLREGVARGECAEIMVILNEFGKRRFPIIPFLPRSNPLNKFLGRLLCRIGIR